MKYIGRQLCWKLGQVKVGGEGTTLLDGEERGISISKIGTLGTKQGGRLKGGCECDPVEGGGGSPRKAKDVVLRGERKVSSHERGIRKSCMRLLSIV